MTKTVKITREFISFRNAQAKECYDNATRRNKRSLNEVKIAMDCLLHEWIQQQETGHEPEDYSYDYLSAEHGYVDVKFIKNSDYSFPASKIDWKLKQLAVLDNLQFCRWVDYPERPLKVGDEVSYEILDTVKFSQVLAQATPANNYYHYQVVKPTVVPPGPGGPLTMTVTRTERKYIERAKFTSRRLYGTLECPGKMGLWMITEKQMKLLKEGMTIEFTYRETPDGYYWIDEFKEV